MAASGEARAAAPLLDEVGGEGLAPPFMKMGANCIRGMHAHRTPLNESMRAHPSMRTCVVFVRTHMFVSTVCVKGLVVLVRAYVFAMRRTHVPAPCGCVGRSGPFKDELPDLGWLQSSHAGKAATSGSVAAGSSEPEGVAGRGGCWQGWTESRFRKRSGQHNM